MNNSSISETTQPLGEQIFFYLKNSILANVLKPGQIIYEKEIAAVFRSSITPVREAIKRLSAEGFIKTTAYRPAIVAEASLARYQKICEALFVLDSYASQSIFFSLTDEHLRKVEDMTREMAKLCSVDTVADYFDLNTRIHLQMWSLLKNDYLLGIMDQAMDTLRHSFLHMVDSQWTLGRSYLKKSLKIHEKLLDVFKSRDISRLKSVVRRHWTITQNSYFNNENKTLIKT